MDLYPYDKFEVGFENGLMSLYFYKEEKHDGFIVDRVIDNKIDAKEQLTNIYRSLLSMCVKSYPGVMSK